MGRGTCGRIVPDGLWEIARPLIPEQRHGRGAAEHGSAEARVARLAHRFVLWLLADLYGSLVDQPGATDLIMQETSTP